MRNSRREDLRTPIAGTSAAPALNEKLRLDSSFSDCAIILRATDMFSVFLRLIPARPANHQEEWDVFRTSRIAISGRPKGM